ncbi:MAG: ompR [Bacteroidetes bacterium]|jgi:DNA-binding response OmpR family regulator|nr:ompR [Bacteroidota bacterium]
MQKANILLVEDEKNFGIVMRDYLQMNGFSVNWCEDGLMGLSQFHKNNFDLCIIDVMMPKMDGFTLVEEIRKTNPHVPVLFLTARSMREDMLKGYKLGADDYIIKPFDTELLLLKLSVILKRSSSTEIIEEKELSFSEFTYAHQMRLLSHSSGTQNKLSPKESDLLNLLLQNRNKVVSKSTLLQKIWKTDDYFAGRSMDVYIVKLRKYLEADKGIIIENIHGSGYCLKC